MNSQEEGEHFLNGGENPELPNLNLKISSQCYSPEKTKSPSNKNSQVEVPHDGLRNDLFMKPIEAASPEQDTWQQFPTASILTFERVPSKGKISKRSVPKIDSTKATVEKGTG